MAERPILFSGLLVRAIRADRKTQTRRVVTQVAGCSDSRLVGLPGSEPSWIIEAVPPGSSGRVPFFVRCRCGAPGDRLWVRESHAFEPKYDHLPGRDVPEGSLVWYQADGDDPGEGAGRGRPSIHMPRWASRIDLEVTDVRLERLHAITAAGVAAEGVDLSDIEGELPGVDLETLARARFAALWDEINGERDGCSWADDPWVWVVEFRQVEVPHG